MRELAGRLLGIAVMALSKDAAQALLTDLGASAAKTGDRKAKFEEVEGALGALGFVLAQCLTGASTPCCFAAPRKPNPCSLTSMYFKLADLSIVVGNNLKTAIN